MRFETLQIHAGYEPEPTTLALAGVFSVELEPAEDLKAKPKEALA